MEASHHNDLVNFIIDLDDEQCGNPEMHLSAYSSDVHALERILREESVDPDSKIRPFMATPLRLAATGPRCC